MKVILIFIFLSLVIGCTSLQKNRAPSSIDNPFYKLQLNEYGLKMPTCTGTLISKEGHVLTAAHCIDRTLETKNYSLKENGFRQNFPIDAPIKHFESYYPKDTTFKFKYLDYEKVGDKLVALKYKDSLYKKAKLAIRVKDVYDNRLNSKFPARLPENFKGFNAKVYATNKGLIVPRFSEGLSSIDTEKYYELFNSGHGQGADFAILQINELKNKKCLRISQRSPMQGSMIYRSSYDAYFRKEHNDRSKKEEDKRYIEAQVFTDEQVEKHYRKQKAEKYFFTFSENKSREGNSGAAVINESGEVAGVLSFMFPEGVVMSNNMIRYESGNVRIEAVWDALSKKKSKDLLSLNSKCDYYDHASDSFSGLYSGLDIKTKYGFTIKENAIYYSQKILKIFGDIEEIQLSQVTPHHREIFGSENSGQAYLKLFNELKSISLGVGGSYAAAYVEGRSPNEMKIVNAINSMEAMDLISILIHEANHLGDSFTSSRHVQCPKYGVDRQPLLGYHSGVELQGKPACDSSRYSSYAMSATAMKNIFKYCTNCSEQDKQRAGFLANEMLKRIIDKKEYGFLLKDFNL